MKKLFILCFVVMAAMTSWAIGRNDGSTKENAIEYDWENGVLHFESEGTRWYRLDLAPLYYADSLCLSITNTSNTESVNVVCQATVRFPVQDVVINSDSIKQTLAPLSTYNGWVLRRELVSARVTEMFFTVSSTGTVKLSWLAFFPTGESCEEAKHGCDYEQEAGTTWYKLYAPYPDERTNLESMIIRFENRDEQGASNSISVSFKTDCNSSVIRTKTFTIESYSEDTVVFPAEYLASLGWPDLVLSCSSSAKCVVFRQFDYYGESCSKPITLNWEQGNNHPAGRELWYKLELMNPDIVPEENDLRIYFENLSQENNSAHATISFACNDPFEIINRGFTLYANGEEHIDFTRDLLEVAGWPNFFINYQSDYDSRIRVDLIPKLYRDTMVTYDTAYVCSGDYYWDDYAWQDHLIEEPTFWTDTIDSIEFLENEIISMDIFHHYAVYPLRDPHLYTKEELDVLPVVEKGSAIDVVSATDALLAKFHNANITYNSGERPMDVTNVKWQVQTGNGWQDMPYTVPENAASVIMRYVVTTECETEFTSADFVFNLSFSSDILTVAQALEIGAGLATDASTDKQYTIRGYVSSIITPFSEQYGNQSFYIADDSLSTANSKANGGFYIYRGKPATGVAIREGSLVELTTAIRNYKDENIENAEQNVLVTVLKEGPECHILSGTCGENLTWTANYCDSVLTISGTGEIENYASQTSVPWYSFKSIFKSIVIEDGVTSIGDYAFIGCRNLASVEIPNSVTSIGEKAFDGCRSLTSVTIPNSVTNIGYMAFASCSSLTSIEIPNSVTNIGSYAFCDCSGLTSVTIPNSVTSVGYFVFYDCSSLTSIIVDANNANYCSLNGVLFNKNITTLIQYPGGKQGAYTIPNAITSIEIQAFSYSSLTSIEIPSSVTNIGEFAFSHCSSLTSVTNYATTPQTIDLNVFDDVDISACTLYVPAESVEAYKAAEGWKDFGTILPIEDTPEPCILASGICGAEGDNLTWTLSCDSVLTISGTGEMAYYEWNYTEQKSPSPWYSHKESITSIVIEDGVTSIGHYAFMNCSALTSVTIGNSVTSIGWYAFSGCSGLTSVTIGNSVTSIRSAAFNSCSGLTSVTIPNSVTSIGNIAFSGCSGLTSVTIPNRVTSIESGAFSGCSGLKSVTIPNSVTSIGSAAFKSCSGLTSVTIPNSVTSIGDEAFYGCKSLTSVTIPNSVTSIGWHAFYHCWNLTSIEISNSVTSIGAGAFDGCSSLTSVTIPNSVTSIGSAAFNSCSGLTSVTIPNSVTSIGQGAFDGCSNITSVTWNAKNCNRVYFDSQVESFSFGNEVEIIPDQICSNMEKLTSMTIGNSVTSIGEYAFSGCSGLTSVTIPNSVTSIGGAAFNSCSGLTSVTIGNSVTSIGSAAFNSCSGLTSVEIPNSVTSIGDEAFATCSSLISLTIGNSVTSIGERAFYGCRNLTSVTIPNNVTSIGEQAFFYCSSLISLTIPNSVTSIGDGAFADCSSLTSVTIPSSVTSIGDWAFARCSGLTSVTNYATTPQAINANVFDNMDISACTLYVPAESVELYKAANVWKDFGTILPIEDTLEPCIIASGTCGAEGDNLTWTLTCDSVLTISGTGDMRNGITNLGWHQYASNISTAVLPDGLTYIGEEAFNNCVNLRSVNMPESVSVLGNKAFVGCESLTEPVYNSKIFAFLPRNYVGSYSIPEGIVTIAAYAFEECISNGGALYEITLPSTIKHLGEHSLGAPYLQKITCLAVNPPMCDTEVFDCFFDDAEVIFYVDRSIPVYVPAESIDAYKSADVWKEFTNIQPIEGTSCFKPIRLDWEQGNIHRAGENLWYYCGVSSDLIPANKDIRLHFENLSQNTNSAHATITLKCDDDDKNENHFSIPTNDEAHIDIERDFFGGTNWWSAIIIMNYQSDYDSRIRLELIPKQRHDTLIVGPEIWYLCEGESMTDDLTGKWHRADSSDPSSLQWSDTIEGGFNAERNMFVDTIYHFQIVIPTAPTLPAISDVLPTLEVKKGEVIDVTAANAALVAALDNGEDESKQAAMEIHWEYSTDGITFTEIDATPVTTEAFSVRFRVITDCDEELISAEVSNQVSGTEPATYTINFVNYDGSIIDSRAWEEGTMPACAEPTKTDDDYIYCFAGWQPQIKTVTETATYQATYDVCGGWLSESVSWQYQGDTLVVFGNGVIPDYEQGTAPWNGFERTVHVVYVADGISRIGEWAFADMSMNAVRIPESVTVIGADAFKGSSSIESVYYEGFDYQWTAINFVNEYSNPMFYGTNLYAKETPVNKLTVSSTDIISANAFIGITAVEVASIETWCAVTITHTETSYEPSFDLIVDGVIVTDVCLQEGVTQINPFVFRGCRSLQSVCIPASMQQIGEDAFSHTPNLTKVLYAGSLEQWCDITFANAEANPACHADLYFGEDKLGTRIEIPASLTSIRAFAFPNKETLDVYFLSHNPSGYMLNSFGEPQEVGNKHFFVPCGTKEDYQYQLNYDASLFTENYTFHYQVLTSQEPMGNVQIVHAPDCEDQRLVIEAIPTNGYQFKLWSDGDTENPRTLVLTQDTALAAEFEKIRYMVTFLNFDGTELQSGEVEYGETPVYTGDTPAKPADAQCTYTFSGWTPEVVAVTSEATYTAVFESIAVEQDTTFIHDGENTDLDGDMETVIVQPGGELNINASGVSIGVLVITADGIHSGQIHHGELPITADHIYLEYILNPWGTTASPNRWYAFAVPFEVDINGGISRSCDNKPLVSGTDFLILEYNGLWRALQGKGWSKKLDGTLEPGNFYMLGIDGTCNRWRFEKKSGRPFEGAAHMPYNDYASGNPKDAGWNGMGNTRLEYSGMNLGGAGIEYMVTYDNRFGKYETHRIEEMDLFVGQPFFIQAEHGGFFDFLHKGSPYLMAARSKKTSLPMMHLTLTNENNTAGTDHLYLTLHEDTDGSYTIGRDVIRMSTDCKTAAQLWCTAEDGTQLSAHGIAEPQTETVVPVEFFVPKDGEYQLEMSARAMDGYEVELLHNGAYAATLFADQPLELTLKAGTTSGYSLRIRRKTPTELDQVPSDKVQCTKVLRDGQLVIIRNGVEYNADGKMLK